MTKVIRICTLGLGVVLALIVLELIVAIGPYVNKLIPCHQDLADSTNCYLAYDIYWMIFLIIMALGFAAALTFRLIELKRKERKN